MSKVGSIKKGRTLRCQVYVDDRDYSQPGQCAMTRGVRAIQLHDTKVLACVPHARIIAGGRRVQLAGGAR